ncbi:MarR family transcriptional regulator [Myxococcaceae bacterium GXIMD 01537]
MELDTLSAGERRFVDALGSYSEHRGGARIGGRILGLLLLAGGPLSLGEIAQLLQVSPASVSTNVRDLIAAGCAELTSVPGDRRHYYVFSGSGWDGYMRLVIESTRAFARVCEQGASAPDVRNKPRLREAVAFFGFFTQELAGTAERWRARRQRPAPRRPRARRSSSR